MSKPSAPRSSQLFVGVDIAHTSFTAAWHLPDQPLISRTFEQTPAGFAAFQHAVIASAIAPVDILIVMEATSSYWIALATAMHEAGFIVSVVNPAAVQYFAKSLSRRSKTDRLDAELLLRFAADRVPQAWTPPPEVYDELRQRLATRDQFIAMRTQTTNHLKALLASPFVSTEVRVQLDEVIAGLQTRIVTLEREIAQVLAKGEWAASAVLIGSIPGLGTITTAWLLVATVNFTTCTTAEAATHSAGLAPLEYRSGTSIRRRASIGHGGNGRLRTALYMATLSATTHNVVLKTFYERLKAAGKAEKVARCAAARKLLQIVFGMVRTGRAFDASYQKLPSSRVADREPDIEIAA